MVTIQKIAENVGIGVAAGVIIGCGIAAIVLVATAIVNWLVKEK